MSERVGKACSGKPEAGSADTFQPGPREYDEDTTRRYDLVYRCGLACVCIAAFAVMVYLASSASLWLDEMFEVEYCRTSSLAEIVTIDPFTPPLFNTLAWCWYRVAPFGELWLRLPSVVLVVASIPLVAAAGHRIGGRRTGFLSAFLLLINAKVATQCALTFRAYGLLFFLPCMLVYLYVRRMQTDPGRLSWKLSLGLGATMLALGYTHYFGILLCCAFFAADLYHLARGRLDGARAKVFAPYAIAVLGFLPWALVAFQTLHHVQVESQTWAGEREHWQHDAAETSIHGLLYWLCGECAEVLGFFHVSTIIIVVVGIYQARRGRFVWKDQAPLVVLVFSVWSVAGLLWAYCAFANPASMLWVERYFTPLVPCVLVVTAWGVAKVFSWIPTSEPVRFAAAFLCVLLLVPTAIGTVNNDLAEGSSTRFYRELAEYLEQEPGISDDGTLVLALVNTTDRGRQLSAWEHYYFDRKDTRSFKVNILDGMDPSVIVNPYDLLQYQSVYVTRQHFDPDLPDAYALVLKKHFNEYETGNPGGGDTKRYVRK